MENFHTHTYRCNHAKGQDRDYVIKAIEEGFSLIGFSDHTPWPYEYTAVHRNRMYPDQLEDYVTSVKNLKEEFKGRIDVRLGLEVEAFTDYYPWLEEKVHQYGIEYLILGNHYMTIAESGFFGHHCSASDMVKVVELMKKAIEKGHFMYIAHPDLMFCNYPTFDSSCIAASKDILSIAQEHKIPIEYNTSGFLKRERGLVKGLGYPTPGFWDLAPDYDVDVYIGLDAHSPSYFSKERYKAASDFLLSKGLSVRNP